MFIFSARFSMHSESTTDIPGFWDPDLHQRILLWLEENVSFSWLSSWSHGSWWQLVAAGGSWWWVGLPGAPRPRRWSMTFWKNHGRILGDPSIDTSMDDIRQSEDEYRRIVEEDEEFGNSNLDSLDSDPWWSQIPDLMIWSIPNEVLAEWCCMM